MINSTFLSFAIFQIFFVIIFLFVISMFIFVFATILKQHTKDNKAPTLTVNAKVVDKRTHYHKSSNSMHSSSSYYVTFEVDSKDRLELHVPFNEYGYLIEGDEGSLTFKGSRFISFERNL